MLNFFKGITNIFTSNETEKTLSNDNTPIVSGSLHTRLKALYKVDDTIPKLIEDDEATPQKIKDYYVKLQMVMNESGGEAQRAYAHDKVSGEKTSIEVGNIFSKVDDKHPEAGKVLLLGAPGVGKTTLLHYMAYSWANGTVWQSKFDYVFRVRLKELLNSDWKSDYDKVELSQNKLACFLHYCLKVQSSSIKLASSEIAKSVASNKDKVLLLLDGYDEIVHLATNNNDYKEIIDSVFTYKNVVMSSRPNAVGNDLKSHFERIIENKGLDQRGIYEYIDRKFTTASKEQQQLNQGLKSFLQKTDQVMDMCKVPINLALISLVWSDGSFRAKFAGADTTYATDSNSNASSRGDFSLGQLYHEVIVWLGKRYMSKFEHKESSKLVDANIIESGEVKFLSKLARKSFEETGKLVTNQAVNEVVKETIGTLELGKVLKFGLLRPEGDSKDISKVNFQFIHLTFQEYLTAYYLKEQLATKDKEIAKEAAMLIARHRNEPKYQMTLKFLAGLVSSTAEQLGKTENAKLLVTRFWEAVTVNLEGVIELGTDSKITLFMHLLSQSKIKGQIDSRIPNLEKIQQLIDENILTDISKWQQQIIESGYLSPKLIAKVKGIIEVALTTKGEVEGESGQHMHLKAAAEIAVAASGTGVFGTKEQLFEQFFSFSKLKDWQLQKLGLEKAAKVVDVSVPQGKLEGVIAKCIELWADKNLISSLSLLVASITQCDSKLVYQNLSKAIKIGNGEIKQAILHILTTISKAVPLDNIQEVLLLLKPWLSDKDSDIRSAVAKAISELAKNMTQEQIKEILPILKAWLADWNSDVRYVAKEAISELVKNMSTEQQLKEILPLLKQLLADKDSWVRSAATYAVREVASKVSSEQIKEILQLLKPLLADKEERVREAAIHAVREVASKVSSEQIKEILQLLKVWLADKDEYVRKAATYAISKLAKNLGQEQLKEILFLLKPWLADKDEYIRKAATYTIIELAKNLGQEQVEEILPLLKPWLADDEVSGVRKVATYAISELAKNMGPEGLKEILPLLKPWLADEEYRVRYAATYAIRELAKNLGQEGHKEILPLLKNLLADEDYRVRYAATYAIRELAKYMGQEQIKEILHLLKTWLADKDSDVRLAATYAIRELAKYMGQEGLEETLPLFKTLLADKDIRFAATEAISKLAKNMGQEERKEILPLLKTLLADPQEYVRSAAASAVIELAKNMGQEQVKEMLHLLKTWLADKNDDARKAATEAIIELAKNLGQEQIKEILLLLKPWLVDWKSNVRYAATEAIIELAKNLGQEGLKEMLHLLKPLLAEYSYARDAATYTIGELAKNMGQELLKEILPLLKLLLADQVSDVRSAAKQGLEAVASALSLDSIIDWLKDPTFEVRSIAKKEIINKLAGKDVGKNKQEKPEGNDQFNNSNNTIPITYKDITALVKLVIETKNSTDADDKEIHDGAGKALQKLTATLDNTGLAWLNEHFAELPNLPELLAFLKAVCHKALSDGRLDETKAKVLVNCVLKKGITATFELNEGIITLDDASYSVKEGRAYLDKIVEEVIVNSTDDIAKQYKEHVPMFVNTETVLYKAATDIKDVSIVDGKELKHNAWKVSLMHRSNHEKVAPSEVFVLIEGSSYNGQHIIKKVAFEQSSGKLVVASEYMVHPYRVEDLREKIFGKMEYAPGVGKVRYYGSEFEVDLDLVKSKRLTDDISQGKTVIKGSEYQALHQFMLGLLPDKLSASELNEDWEKYVAHSGTGVVQEFNKLQLLKIAKSQFDMEENMADSNIRHDKSEQRLQKLENSYKAFEQVKQKLKTDLKISQETRELMSKKLILMEGKLQGLADKEDLEIITAKVIEINSETEFNQDRILDLEKQVDKMLAHDATDADAKTEVIVNMVSSITYDNPLLNHQELLVAASKVYGLNKALDLSSHLSLEFLQSAVETGDFAMLLAGLMSVDNNI